MEFRDGDQDRDGSLTDASGCKREERVIIIGRS